VLPLADENPTTRTPYLTVAFITANVAVFLWQASGGEVFFAAVTHGLAAVPHDLVHPASGGGRAWVPAPATLVTSTFLHGGVLHLGFNMLFLWIFGNNVEDVLGHGSFVLFYLICGAGATLAHVATDPSSTLPLVGASGAISGVMGAYLYHFPWARVRTLIVVVIFIRIVRLPALVFIGLWFVVQLMSAPGGGQVAWYAHIGGFVLGLGLAVVWPAGARRRR
jgi:membrane associated rhomboid family serine protease